VLKRNSTRVIHVAGDHNLDGNIESANESLGHAGSINEVVFCGEGKTLASASNDSTVKVSGLVRRATVAFIVMDVRCGILPVER
jgi:WD40 repeat protein